MFLFGFILEDGPEVKPSIKSFVLIFGVDEVQKILFFEILQLNVLNILVIKVNNFLPKRMIFHIILFILFHLHHCILCYWADLFLSVLFGRG